MHTIKIKPIERYEVTRKLASGTVEVVTSDLTRRQADDIAGAMIARAEAAGIACEVIEDEGAER